MAQTTRFAAVTVPHPKTLTRSERGAAAAGSANTPSPERRHHRDVTPLHNTDTTTTLSLHCASLPSAELHRRTCGGSGQRKVPIRPTL